MDLSLAWKRTKFDISRKRIIGSCAFEFAIVEKEAEAYLNQLGKEIHRGYTPGNLTICDIPKGKGLVRPGGRLSLKDRVVYNAVVSDFYPKILKKLLWSQEKIDYGNVPSGRSNQPEWIKNPFESWKAFIEKSLKKIDEGFNYVVSTDIAAYYENINHRLLLSDLSQLGVDSEHLQLLGRCLKRWYLIGRGIPQGFFASDILSKLYLDSIDENLKKEGYVHLRYSDDTRIFCKNLTEARKSLLVLNGLLRSRGLNLQSGKTDILPASEAKIIFQGGIPVIESVRRKVLRTHWSNPSLNDSDLDVIAILYPPSSIEIIKEAYKANFLDSPKAETFGKSLFHYLLNGLGALKNDFALIHCLSLIYEKPEETEVVLKYFTKIEASVDDELVRFLNSAESIYSYQNFQIMEWFSERDTLPEEVVFIARRFCFDENQPIYLKSVSRKIIGSFGSPADLEKIEDSYSRTSNQLEQCEIICSLKRMEVSKRNAFYSRVKDDSLLHKMAVNFAKA